MRDLSVDDRYLNNFKHCHTAIFLQKYIMYQDHTIYRRYITTLLVATIFSYYIRKYPEGKIVDYNNF